MSELRLNLATREWIIFATERARRPEEFAAETRPARIREPYSPTCPFCPGNPTAYEADPTLVVPGDDGWAVRVLPNRYPALVSHEPPQRSHRGVFHRHSGFGYHEVIVEHPRHDLSLAEMSVPEVYRVLWAYWKRYQALQADSRVGYVVVFKNHGVTAGTSMEHPHSQLIATPVVPSEIRARMATAMAYYDDSGDCVYCRLLQEELASGERIVRQSESFVAYIPYAAYSPFHIWIFPRRHAASFGECTEPELAELASVLRNVLYKLRHGLNDPDYNLVLRCVPESAHFCQYYHWYLSVVPRLTRPAGFELGSGMFINTALPEESARFLRSQADP